MKRELDPDEEPPTKKKLISTNLDAFFVRGSKHDEFHRDVVKAFAASNIPLSKLEAGMVGPWNDALPRTPLHRDPFAAPVHKVHAH